MGIRVDNALLTKFLHIIQKIKQNDPLRLRGIKVRFAIILVFAFLGIVLTPVLGFAFILPPLLLLVSIAIAGNVVSFLWMLSVKWLKYRVYFATLVDTLLITVAVHYLGGIQGSFSWIYAIALMAIASLNGVRVGIYAAAVSCLMYSTLLLAEFAQVIEPVDLRLDVINPVYLHKDTFYLYSKLLTDGILFFVTVLVSGSLSERLMQRKQEVDDRNEQLLREIGERKRTEEELRNSEERFKVLFEYAPDAYYLTDFEGRFVDGNRAAEELVGYKRDEMVGKSFLDLDILSPDQLPIAAHNLAENFQGKVTGPVELLLNRRDGRRVAVEIRTYPVKIGDHLLALGSARDITERKQADEAIRRSEEHFRSLIENALDAISIIGTDGTIIYESPSIERILGYKPEEVIGTSIFELVHPDDRERIVEISNHIIQSPDAVIFEELRCQHKDGSFRLIEALAKKAPNERAIIANYRDVTGRKQAEESLRNSERSYRLLADNVTDIIWTADLNLKFTFISPSITHIRGYSVEEAMAQSMEEVLTPASFEVAGKALEEELAREDDEHKDPSRSRTLELEHYCKDGSTIWTEVKVTFLRDQTGRASGILGVTRDITEQRQLRQQLLQAQKMESIGTLAGGIAHDFNNLLAGVLGYASLTKTKISQDHPISNYIDTIEKSAVRAAELTAQLLAFARGGKYEAKAVNLNSIVEETLTIITRTFDKSIDIEVHTHDPLPSVEADAGQMQQILMNLCVNARDAMPDGGKLIIETGLAQLTENYAKAHVDAKPGMYVCLSVTDTGVGMSKGTIQRVFEPFFNTKPQGKGTGLGLAMVYGVVKNHGGYVCVYSEPEEGSTFKVYLPVCGMPELDATPGDETPRRGCELILVVDDEESVRLLAKDMLETYGYKVLLAEDGAKAIEILKENSGSIDLVILDLVMPKMGGRETFLKLKEINPKIKVLLSTGYSQNGKAKELLGKGVVGFLQKPYHVDGLLLKVRAVLDGKMENVFGQQSAS
jgi:two-component system cell cycle sensor histidine kinase/response regulator CckA